MLSKRLTNLFQKFATFKTLPSCVVLSKEVQNALAESKPVVALESTIISHGMPFPQNLECAQKLESIILSQNVEPATIAIIDSKIHIGLTKQQLQRFAEQGSKGNVRKASRRDLSYCLQTGQLGATTVSGTMACAHMAGIELFVTGGVGGVHRGVQQTWDISADLTELGRTPVTVISAGVKSILDIPKTLQYLETEGVPVVTYNSDEFPAFYTTNSGIKTPFRLNTYADIARLIDKNAQLNLLNGILVCVPNPHPASSQQITKAIQESIAELKEKNIKGHAVSPFLLKRVAQKTKGKSLESNIALVQNNAKAGAEIAIQLAKLRAGVDFVRQQQSKKVIRISKSKLESKRPIVIGGSAIDTYIKPLPGKEFVMGMSNAGKVRTSFGGVGRNIAQVAGRLGVRPIFITPLGVDDSGKQIVNYLKKVGVNVHQIFVDSEVTGVYMHVMKKNGDLSLGVADMDVNNHLTFNNIYQAFFKKNTIVPGTIVQIDSNVPTEELKRLVPFLNEQKAIILYQGISTKATRIFESGCIDQISMLKMNHIELTFYTNLLKQKLKSQKPENDYAHYMGELLKMIGTNNQYHKQIKPFKYMVVTHGEDGSNLHFETQGNPQFKKFPVLKCNVIKTNGAGDTMTGTLISSLSKGYPMEQAVKLAICGTKFAVQTPVGASTISQRLTFFDVQKLLQQNPQL